MSYADTPQVRFHYVCDGAGSPVLLIPGSGGWRLTFDRMLGELASRHTVYALDPPGQGGTRVLDPDFDYTTDGIARSIGAFLDAVGLPEAAIVGHSWGGGFALRLAQLQSERVTRLVLMAPGGLEVHDAWEFRILRLPVLGELASRFISKSSVLHMLRKSFARHDRIPVHLLDEAVQAMRARPTREAMLRVERSVGWAETEHDLHLVRLPILLLWGERDRYFPVNLIDRFTTRLPHVEPHILPDAGHSLHDDYPDRAYALLKPFLA